MKIFKQTNSKKEIRENMLNSEAYIRELAVCSTEEIFEKFSSGMKGITTEKAEEIQEEIGLNVIITDNKNTVFTRLKEAVINPFNIVLFIIAVITFFTDVIFSPTNDYVTTFIILFLIILSSLVAFVQNERSNSETEKLFKMISNKADVYRDGKIIEISMDQVVPGDIVKLSAGDMIPADVRFLSTKDTFVAQSALTGESNPVEKFSNKEIELDVALTDLVNIGFMGSNIVSGSATAIVIATGNNTFFGSMAKSLAGDRAKNSFEKGVDSVSGLLIRLMLLIIPIVFFINGITKGDWVEALLFSITIAVGLTPEMLPMIMTSTLARGAVSMSKRKVIVKSLGAIQTFGEMDILCTDKTGTLTEDKIILEKYMNVTGNSDMRILRHSYLNSHFQTGLKNLIDLAIINRAKEKDMESILERYECIDEIPFDFSRRRMSVVLEDNSGKRQLITKGAVEEVLSISSFIEVDGKIMPIDEETRKTAMETYERYNSDGLRMLAIAQKNNVPDEGAFSIADERDMVLIGFVGFLDPPKESAVAAVKALKEHGVRVVVLTGDSEGVAVKVCKKVGVETALCLTGSDVEKMDDMQIKEAVKKCDLFSKLSPAQKQRIVRTMQEEGHTVGYMGDGINDAPPLHQADVGISVDSAVDIAKETADIILLEKDLMVLEEGVIEGRKTFGNIIKYIKMAASGNLGNMISVIAASIFLPFLPMLPVQILTQNLLCDFSQIGMPFDSVDKDYIKQPRKWETGSIKSFMAVMGPLSSVFDILVFAIMWWVMGAKTQELSPLFQCGWFLFGTLSQVLVIYVIRTAEIPFIKSNPSGALYISTAVVAVIAVIIGFTDISFAIDMSPLPLSFIPWIAAILAGYFIAAQICKGLYVRFFGEWL